MKINFSFFVLFFITFTVAISDIIIYFFDFNFIIVNCWVGLINFLLFYKIIKNKKIELEKTYNKYDLIFIVPLGIYLLVSIVFPDLSWDTRSYHIYLQENTFYDKINYDFFAARNLNSFLFPLGDRINYLFRIILGYRLGTLPSYFLMVILYFQIKKLIKYFIENKNEIFYSITGIIPVVSSIIFAFSGTYYIDNFGLVFLFEIFSLILMDEDLIKSRLKLIYLSFLIGFSIAIKVTNAIFLIPLGIYFLINNYKNLKDLKIIDFISIIISVILPWGIYFLDNYFRTGNPVFPYYNNIFKSEFFMNESWKDNNFGPENIFQFIFWPLYIVVNPKRAFDTKFVDLSWGIGFVLVITFIIYCIKNKSLKSNKMFALALITFINYYLWEKMLIGYVRYATIILVFSLIISIYFISECVNKSKIKILGLAILILISIPSIGYDLLIVVKDYKSISEFFSEYKGNVCRLFVDRKNDKINLQGVIGAIGDDSLLPTLLRNEQNPIYNIEEWVTITNDKTQTLYDEKIKDVIIYVPVDKKIMERKEQYLKNNQFEIISRKELNGVYTFLSPSDNLYLYEVKKTY